jgi:hypothetical protein
MHTVHPHPRRRAFPAFLALLAIVVALLGFAGVAAQSRSTTDTAASREPAGVKAEASEPTVYFPSQFKLQARDSEPHIEAF